MKNIEKYYDELIQVFEDKDADVRCYWSRNIVKEPCKGAVLCAECLEQFFKWPNEEYRKPIAISADERAILRNLLEDFKYIARDSDTSIFIYKTRPTKDECGWIDEALSATSLNLYTHLFQFIEWEDDEPYSIEELLKEDTYEPGR